mmetsp:Transcript_1099/g.4035  ORF Transcript_1099/g.4035 Transcript_1099/m.4035 type:complete len:335 (-) Transcript_1099:1892-2896(-)
MSSFSRACVHNACTVYCALPSPIMLITRRCGAAMATPMLTAFANPMEPPVRVMCVNDSHCADASQYAVPEVSDSSTTTQFAGWHSAMTRHVFSPVNVPCTGSRVGSESIVDVGDSDDVSGAAVEMLSFLHTSSASASTVVAWNATDEIKCTPSKCVVNRWCNCTAVREFMPRSHIDSSCAIGLSSSPSTMAEIAFLTSTADCAAADVSDASSSAEPIARSTSSASIRSKSIVDIPGSGSSSHTSSSCCVSTRLGVFLYPNIETGVLASSVATTVYFPSALDASLGKYGVRVTCGFPRPRSMEAKAFSHMMSAPNARATAPTSRSSSARHARPPM